MKDVVLLLFLLICPHGRCRKQIAKESTENTFSNLFQRIKLSDTNVSLNKMWAHLYGWKLYYTFGNIGLAGITSFLNESYKMCSDLSWFFRPKKDWG